MTTEALVLRGVRHSFGATVALDDAQCTVRRGTIHALLGENGAGKTTLMRIAFGMLTPDAGMIAIDGAPVALRSSRDAIARGVGMVHQHFSLVPALRVAENVALGGRGRLDRRAVAARIEAIGRDTGLALDPDARVADLPVGAQQRVEIVKALARDARVLILDEPTAVLSPSEGAELLAWLRGFADRGGSVVLITHKLQDALRHADDITVLRRGRTMLVSPRASVDDAQVIRALVGDAGGASGAEGADVADGAAPERRVAAPSGAPLRAAPVLALAGVDYVDPRGVTRLRGVDLAVHAGEVLGVIGVEGAGQRELLRLLAGRLAPTRGRVTRPPRVGFIPEDRLHDAVIPAFTLTENLALAAAGDARARLPWGAIRADTQALLRDFDVRARGADARMHELSGGNQQRFVVGREKRLAAAALVAENPTRGLDLRATSRVLAEVGSARGLHPPAVVFHSSDLDEVLAVATRVVACFNGTVREVAPPPDPADRTPYARAMVGAD